MEIIAHYTNESGSRLTVADTTDNSTDRLVLGTLVHVLFLFPKPRLTWTITTTLEHGWKVIEKKEIPSTSRSDFAIAKVQQLAWAAQFAKENNYRSVAGLHTTSK